MSDDAPQPVVSTDGVSYSIRGPRRTLGPAAGLLGVAMGLSLLLGRRAD